MKNNWHNKKLGEIIKLEYGKPMEKTDRHADGLYPVYGANGIKCYSDRYLYKKQSIIVGRKGSAGELNLTSDKFWALDVTYYVTFNETANDIKFIYYLLKTLNLNSLAKGVKPGINRNDVYSLNIKVPQSLSEQKHIVEHLDKIFQKIESVIQNTEIKIQNSHELFESYLKNVFANLRSDWEHKKLSEVCEKITDGTHQTPIYFDDGYIFLSSKNVKSGKIDWENIKYIDKKQHQKMHKRVSPRLNDILLAKNGTTGIAAIVDKDITFDIYVSLALLRPISFIDSSFLLYFINSPVAKEQFNKRLKGSGVPNLHLQEIREVNVKYPTSIAEQKKIVKKLDELSEKTRKLEEIYKKKLADLEELKKSVLQKAFLGELL